MKKPKYLSRTELYQSSHDCWGNREATFLGYKYIGSDTKSGLDDEKIKYLREKGRFHGWHDLTCEETTNIVVKDPDKTYIEL